MEYFRLFINKQAIKVSKLKILATKFEQDAKDESTAIFNGKLKDIVNKTFHLGKRYLYMKIIQKTLKSLLKSLDAKVAAIEEA